MTVLRAGLYLLFTMAKRPWRIECMLGRVMMHLGKATSQYFCSVKLMDDSTKTGEPLPTPLSSHPVEHPLQAVCSATCPCDT